MAIKLMQIRKVERQLKVLIDLVSRTDVDIAQAILKDWDEASYFRKNTEEGDKLFLRELRRIHEKYVVEWEKRNNLYEEGE